MTEISEIVIATLLYYRERGEYLLHEFVLMPDHLHLLVTPSSWNSLEKVMQFIKGGSSYRLRQQRGQKLDLWHAGFHDWTIRDAGDWSSKAQYIRLNPVKAGLVEREADWPHSSVSGKFSLDAVPPKYLQVASAAKADSVAPPMSELKLRPPKEEEASGRYQLDSVPQRLTPSSQSLNVGAEGPTPNSCSKATNPVDPIPAKYLSSGAKAQALTPTMSDPKVRPPKEKTGEPISGQAKAAG